MFVHNRNYGYGANQKTCYREALGAGADVVVMVHPDYQYDPTLVPDIIAPILRGGADVVLGSRLLGEHPVRQGMPWWKYIANRALTWLENVTFKQRLSEYHTGYRGYSRHALETVNFEMNADRFVFDQEILAQFVNSGLRVTEVPVPTRYFAGGIVGVVPAKLVLRPGDSAGTRPVRVASIRAGKAASLR